MITSDALFLVLSAAILIVLAACGATLFGAIQEKRKWERLSADLPKDTKDAQEKVRDAEEKLDRILSTQRNVPVVDRLYFKVLFLGPINCGKTWIWRTWSMPWEARPETRTAPKTYPRATITVYNTLEWGIDFESDPKNRDSRPVQAMSRYVIEDDNLGVERKYGVMVLAELYDSSGEIGTPESEEKKKKLIAEHVTMSQRSTRVGLTELTTDAAHPVILLFFLDFVGNVEGPEAAGQPAATSTLGSVPLDAIEINDRYYSESFCEELNDALTKSKQRIVGAGIVFSQSDRMTTDLKTGRELERANAAVIRRLRERFQISDEAVRVVSAKSNEGVNQLYLDVASRGVAELLKGSIKSRKLKEGGDVIFTPPEKLSEAGRRLERNVTEGSPVDIG